MTVLALDFETGGLDPQRHGPVQLGVAIMDGHDILHERQWIIAPKLNKKGKPALEYDITALSISGLTWKQIVGGEQEPDVLAQFAGMVDGYGVQDATIVSHNAVFDAAFLSQMVFRCGTWDFGKFKSYPEPLRGPWACTRRMSWQIDGLPDRTLDTVAAHFGLRRNGENHDALEDAILAARIYAAMQPANK